LWKKSERLETKIINKKLIPKNPRLIHELPFDLFWGDVFVIGGSTTLAFAILGASVFRHSLLKEIWLLLVIGIFLWMLADVWYYYMEIFEAYYSSHPVNTMWMASFLLIIYSLYKHHKVLHTK